MAQDPAREPRAFFPGTSPTPSGGLLEVLGLEGGPLKLQPFSGLHAQREAAQGRPQLGPPGIPQMESTLRVQGSQGATHGDVAGAGRDPEALSFGVTCPWAVASPNLDLMNWVDCVQQGSA